jgi:gas vesicle protein
MDRGDLSSFLLGLGVGIGIGILFAPKSGEETRGLIKNKAQESTEFLKQRSGEFKESANDWIEKGKDAIGRQRDNLSEAMEAGKQAYRESVGQPSPPHTPTAS